MADLSYVIGQIKDRILVSDIVRQSVQLRRQGRAWSGLCPFHQEKSPSFTVNDDKGFYHCFGCGAHGDVISFVSKTENLDFMESLERLAISIGINVDEYKTAKNPNYNELKQVQQSAKDLLKKAAEYFQKQLNTPKGFQALTYIKSRGLTNQIRDDFALGYAPISGLIDYMKTIGYDKAALEKAGLITTNETGHNVLERFRNRLMFPIHNAKDEIVGFGGRILDNSLPKYLNSPETELFNKSQTLYGLNKAKKHLKEYPSFIVVEGYMDVISMHQAGFQTAVAPLGTSLTAQHLNLMWKYDPRPILCFDGDKAGQKAALRAAHNTLAQLESGKTLRFCFLPEGEDPDSLIQKEMTPVLQELLNSPVALCDVLWNWVVQTMPFQTPEDKAYFKKHMLDILQVIPDAALKDFYIQEFKDRYYLMLETLKKNQQQHNTAKSGSFQNLGQSQKVYNISLNPNMAKSLFVKHQKIVYYILFATSINHPDLLCQYIEELAHLDIQDHKLALLCEDLVLVATSQNQMTPENIKKELQLKGHNDLLLNVLSEETYMHANFARPESDYDKAVEGWAQIFQMLNEKNEVQALKHKIQYDLGDDFNENDWQYLKMVKKGITSAV